ncbi:IclR helix-turn-helix domain-containing protein [Duganella sp. CF517]|nr:IclR helix-turn-helix domain-containing protein [Duganella sp. CF517]
MALLGIIRRWHIRDQVPLTEIARRLGISRNTVRRYLRSETTEPSYADRRSPSAIDKYAFQLSGLLKTEAAKSRKQRRTLKQLHEELRELGFEGSYDRVAAFARVWRAGQTDRVNSASKRTGRQRRAKSLGVKPPPRLHVQMPSNPHGSKRARKRRFLRQLRLIEKLGLVAHQFFVGHVEASEPFFRGKTGEPRLPIF